MQLFLVVLRQDQWNVISKCLWCQPRKIGTCNSRIPMSLDVVWYSFFVKVVYNIAGIAIIGKWKKNHYAAWSIIINYCTAPFSLLQTWHCYFLFPFWKYCIIFVRWKTSTIGVSDCFSCLVSGVYSDQRDTVELIFLEFCYHIFKAEWNCGHFADSNFKYIFLMKTWEFQIRYHWHVLLKVQFIVKPTLVQAMA